MLNCSVSLNLTEITAPQPLHHTIFFLPPLFLRWIFSGPWPKRCRANLWKRFACLRLFKVKRAHNTASHTHTHKHTRAHFICLGTALQLPFMWPSRWKWVNCIICEFHVQSAVLWAGRVNKKKGRYAQAPMMWTPSHVARLEVSLAGNGAFSPAFHHSTTLIKFPDICI